jgi:hypothetical protein
MLPANTVSDVDRPDTQDGGAPESQQGALEPLTLPGTEAPQAEHSGMAS